MDSILGSSLAIAAGAITLNILAGVPPLLARAPTPATAAEAVAHLVRWAVLFATLVVVIPFYERMFADFGVKLPAVAAAVIRASDTATVWMPGLLLVAAGMTALFHRLYRNPATRRRAKGLSVVSTAVAIAAVVGVIGSLALPLIRIVNGLS